MMNGTLEALGWTLIHFCWQAAAIATLYLLADLGLKNARSHTRYVLSLATLSSMFLMFAATLGYETWHNPAVSPFQFNTATNLSAVTAPVNAITSKVGSLANRSVTLRLTALLPWLDGIWVFGVAGLSMRSLGGWMWLQRLRRVTMEEAPEAIKASFERVCIKLGIARLPELRLSEIVPGPITIGVLRTLVLLPASALLALSPEQLEAIFAHELAHVRRADYFWNLVQTLAETLFFFHPAVWWLGKRLREQRELCCDDIAIESCSDPLVYATALFRLEDQRAAGLNLAMALDGHQSSITFRSRILRILGESFPQSPAARLRPLSLFAVCASLFLFLSPLPKALGGIASQYSPKIAGPVLQHPGTANVTKASPRLNGTSAGNSFPSKRAEAQRSEINEPPPHIASAQGAFTDTPPPHIASSQEPYADVPFPHIANTAGAYSDTPPPHIGEHGLVEVHVGNPTGDGRPGEVQVNVNPRFITDSILAVTPRVTLSPTQLKKLSGLGMNPEYANSLMQRFPEATFRDLMEVGGMHIDENFIALAKSRGYENLTIRQLIRLRASGVLTSG